MPEEHLGLRRAEEEGALLPFHVDNMLRSLLGDCRGICLFTKGEACPLALARLCPSGRQPDGSWWMLCAPPS